MNPANHRGRVAHESGGQQRIKTEGLYASDFDMHNANSMRQCSDLSEMGRTNQPCQRSSSLGIRFPSTFLHHTTRASTLSTKAVDTSAGCSWTSMHRVMDSAFAVALELKLCFL